MGSMDTKFAQKRQCKGKLKTKELRRNGPGNSPWRQSGRKKWNMDQKEKKW